MRSESRWGGANGDGEQRIEKRRSKLRGGKANQKDQDNINQYNDDWDNIGDQDEEEQIEMRRSKLRGGRANQKDQDNINQDNGDWDNIGDQRCEQEWDNSNCNWSGLTRIRGRFVDWVKLTGVENVNLAFFKLGQT